MHSLARGLLERRARTQRECPDAFGNVFRRQPCAHPADLVATPTRDRITSGPLFIFFFGVRACVCVYVRMSVCEREPLAIRIPRLP